MANISQRHLTSLTGPKLAILPQRPGAGIKDMGRHIEAQHLLGSIWGLREECKGLSESSSLPAA